MKVYLIVIGLTLAISMVAADKDKDDDDDRRYRSSKLMKRTDEESMPYKSSHRDADEDDFSNSPGVMDMYRHYYDRRYGSRDYYGSRRRSGSSYRRRRPHYKSNYMSYDDDDEYYSFRDFTNNRRDSGYHEPTGYYHDTGDDDTGINPLALIVAPLAGIAFLTAAAAVAANPVLITISLTGRKKRDVSGREEEELSPAMIQKLHELQVLEKFMSSVPEEQDYQHQVLAMYLTCSGHTDQYNLCLDRVVCEYANPAGHVPEDEKDVISIVLYNIMSNTYISEGYKNRLRAAARIGRDEQRCHRYSCAMLAQQNRIS